MSLLPVISLHQPWATLIAMGLKVHETRHWQYPKRLEGQRIAIHAAQRVEGDVHPLIIAALRKEFGTGWRLEIPRGAVICTAILAGCYPTELRQGNSALDKVAGNWEPGRFAWQLKDVRAISEPFITRGRQSFWTLDLGGADATFLQPPD